MDGLLQRRHTLLHRQSLFLEEPGRPFLAIIHHLARFLEYIHMVGAKGEEYHPRYPFHPLQRMQHAHRVVHGAEGIHRCVEPFLGEAPSYAVGEARAHEEHLLQGLYGEVRFLYLYGCGEPHLGWVLLRFSATTYLETLVAQRHVDETRRGLEWMSRQCLLDACRRLRVFRHHIEVATAPRSWQLIA